MTSPSSKSLLTNIPVYPNSITDYTASIFQSEFSRANGQLSRDVTSIMNGHCFYHKTMLCQQYDYQLIDQLLGELKAHELSQSGNNNGIINWNHHFKYDDPTFSPTFHLITQLLGEYFDLNVLATRLNIYTPTDWKTFHHDSHKYSQGEKEDFTVGLSLGGTRSLSFLHPPTGATFEFPQGHGDVFAFDSDVNAVFMHGVPKLRTEPTAEHGPRLSIICWGKRKVMTERNCGKDWREKEIERKELEREQKHFWNEANDTDEAKFAQNNNKYSHFVAPAAKSDGGRPNPEGSTPEQTVQGQPTQVEKEVVPGIPLDQVEKLMAAWCQHQLTKKAKTSQLKTIFHSANYTPLLNLVLDAFSGVGGGDAAGNMGLGANKTNVDGDQLTRAALQKHSSLKQHSDHEEVLRLQSMPVVYSTDQVLVGPRGLKIRVGATNRRFELISGQRNQALSQSTMSKSHQQQQQQKSVEESIREQDRVILTANAKQNFQVVKPVVVQTNIQDISPASPSFTPSSPYPRQSHSTQKAETRNEKNENQGKEGEGNKGKYQKKGKTEPKKKTEHKNSKRSDWDDFAFGGS